MEKSTLKRRTLRLYFAMGVATGALVVLGYLTVTNPDSKAAAFCRSFKTYWHMADLVPADQSFFKQTRMLFQSSWNLSKYRPGKGRDLVEIPTSDARDFGANFQEAMLFNNQLPSIKLLDVYLQDCLRSFARGRLSSNDFGEISKDLGFENPQSLFTILARGAIDFYELMGLAEQWGISTSTARLYFKLRFGLDTDALKWSHSMLREH